MNKYAIYGNCGCIDEVIFKLNNNKLDCFSSLKDVFICLINRFDSLRYKKIEDFKLIYYAYDDRLNKNVYMIITDHSGYKDQFVSYLIELN